VVCNKYYVSNVQERPHTILYPVCLNCVYICLYNLYYSCIIPARGVAKPDLYQQSATVTLQKVQAFVAAHS
jgi:hypothetical protein